MNRKYKRILLCGLILTMAALPLQAELKKVGQTGYQFLKIDANARAAAMGGAVTLSGLGAENMFYNPAGLARQSMGMDVVSNQTQWFADISYITIGVSKRFGSLGTFGFSYQTANYGDIIGTQVADNELGFVETGNVDVAASAIGIAYAKNLTDKFSVGGHMRYASQKLGENEIDGETVANETDGLVWDFGTIFYPNQSSFRFGMSIRNFSQEMIYEQYSFELPITFTIGVAADLFEILGMAQNQSLLLAFDAVHPRDYTERVHLGMEYGFNDLLFFRTGYKFNYDSEGFSVGGGVNLSLGKFATHISYALSQAGDFSPVNRVTISANF